MSWIYLASVGVFMDERADSPVSECAGNPGNK